ncbi:protein strictosidine synthase-like 3 [Phtheirospermum japonicum]|uniref:Protein strictosidine synthase-like 3 n=1 Tax=Phtheirospermum japonicum TaxID=374723 RepID=A0A830BPA1_9LAMI|nr:protein strictosidine synthase-like 3 [Phtheirospermum japonicum]
MTPAGVFAGVFLLLAVYCAVDPFNHSAMSEFPDFEAVKVQMPAWSEIPAERDHENLLQKSEIRFLNQVQGPESMAFDPMGRGPYTGVADGRIIFWDGHKWNDFAYTSAANRNFLQLVFTGDDSGRVLKYDPNTKETTVLIQNLQFPNGLSMSKDGSFFVFCEGAIGRYDQYRKPYD